MGNVALKFKNHFRSGVRCNTNLTILRCYHSGHSYSFEMPASGFKSKSQKQAARHMFDKMPDTNFDCQTTFIPRSFNNTNIAGFRSSQFHFAGLLKACSKLGFPEHGMTVHAHIIKAGFESGVYAGTALVNMYAKCGYLEDAFTVFAGLHDKNLVSWNAMISGYAQSGFAEETLGLTAVMFHDYGMRPNAVTLSCILSCCKDLEIGKQLHAFCIMTGTHLDVFVASALVNMYANCQRMDLASLCFSESQTRDSALWTALISGYVLCGQVTQAMEAFREFRYRIPNWSHLSLISALALSSASGCLNLGIQLQSHVIKEGFESNAMVMNSLLHMYCRCKHFDKAYHLFNSMPKQGSVPWNVMITGCTQNGDPEYAVALFVEMQKGGSRPDEDTFSGVLTACSSWAQISLAGAMHAWVIKIGFLLHLIVNNSLLNLYAKCGSMENAYKVFSSILHKDVFSWTAMISGLACHGHGCGWEAIRLFNQMQTTADIRPNHVTFLAVLMACSQIGLVDKGLMYFNTMTQVYNIRSGLEHYACIVDLLARAGNLEEALCFILKMPLKADAIVWKTLLGGCRNHGNMTIGSYAAQQVLALEPNDHATCMLLCHIYEATGRWDAALLLRKFSKTDSTKEEPDCSWLELHGMVHVFTDI